MTRRGYLVLLLAGITLASGLATGFALSYRLVYILLLILAASFLWSRVTLWKVQAEAERHTTRTHVGDVADERVWVRNTTWLTKLWLEVEDLSDLPGHSSPRVLHLPARSFRSWKVETLCRRRGLYTLGPLRVRAGDIFGLFRWERAFSGSQQLLVYPKVVDLPSFRVPGSDLMGDGAVKMRTTGVTPQVAGLREYVHGDSAHRIHWPSSLRMGRLMAKEFDIGLTTDVWLFLDLQASVQAENGEESTDETMVTIAASIAARVLRTQLPVGLVGYGAERYFLPSQRGAAYLDRILELLAGSRAGGTVPLEAALAAEERLFTRFSTLVILTPSAHEEWKEAVRVLRQRRIHVAVVLLDASTFGGKWSPERGVSSLAAQGVPSATVRRGDDLDEALKALQGSLPQTAIRERERVAWI